MTHYGACGVSKYASVDFSNKIGTMANISVQHSGNMRFRSASTPGGVLENPITFMPEAITTNAALMIEPFVHNSVSLV